MLKVDPEKCILCEICKNACPERAIEIWSGRVRIDICRCTGCGICKSTCSRGAIK